MKMLVLPLLFACACAALAVPLEKQIFDLNNEAQLVQLFKDFEQKYKKNYHLSMRSNRYDIFVENLAKINAMNKRDPTAIFGINKYTDMTTEEFLAARTGLLPDPSSMSAVVVNASNIPDIEVPKQFDWRDQKVVTSVKDQGHCGSCWAFSAVGNVEGQYAMKHGALVDFSPQELVSCVTEDKDCHGSSTGKAFQSLIELGGIETDQDYPYTSGSSHKSGTCKFDSSRVKAVITSYKTFKLSSMNEDKVAQLLVDTGPLSIALHATALNYYDGGIIIEHCMVSQPGDHHAVLLVGYGEDNGIPYWLVKNSWGTNGRHSGEHGYFRMKRGVNCLGFLDVHDYVATTAVVA